MIMQKAMTVKGIRELGPGSSAVFMNQGCK